MLAGLTENALPCQQEAQPYHFSILLTPYNRVRSTVVLPNSPLDAVCDRLCFGSLDMFLLSQWVEFHRLSSTSVIEDMLNNLYITRRGGRRLDRMIILLILCTQCSRCRAALFACAYCTVRREVPATMQRSIPCT